MRSLVVLHELHQDPAGAARVQEGYQVPSGAVAGLLVDELETEGGQAIQLGTDVGGPVGHVVKAGTVALQEAGDGGVAAEGFEELQLSHEGHANALGRQAFIEWDGFVQAGRGHGNVIDG